MSSAAVSHHIGFYSGTAVHAVEPVQATLCTRSFVSVRVASVKSYHMTFYSSIAVHAVVPVQATPAMCFNPFSTAVPFWGQTIQILSSWSPNRGYDEKYNAPVV